MDAPLLTDDFKEFLRLLNANRVDYLLVGGYAVGLHGYPRATVDLDVWVRATLDNACETRHSKCLTALPGFHDVEHRVVNPAVVLVLVPAHHQAGLPKLW